MSLVAETSPPDMPRVLLSDHDFPDLELERTLFADAGIDLAVAQCGRDAEGCRRRAFERMRPGSYVVNTAQGAIVDPDDLLAALDGGILAGAGLDVLPVEPVAPDSSLLGDPKVILTPHVAFFSVKAEIELRRKAARNIVTWQKTGRPDYVVVAGTRRPGHRQEEGGWRR
jgi:D-3-phosphoglycerate dehydrogenase